MIARSSALNDIIRRDHIRYSVLQDKYAVHLKVLEEYVYLLYSYKQASLVEISPRHTEDLEMSVLKPQVPETQSAMVSFSAGHPSDPYTCWLIC